MIRTLYSWALWLAQPLLRRKLRRRAVAEPGYGEAIEQRFGDYADLPATGGGYVWVHAVSLGETRAAAALIAQLRQALPGMCLLLTHGTATGREQGRALLQEGDVQVWQPWDTPGAVRRFLTRFQPRVGLLMETEVWPNLVAGCATLRVPLCLVNARLSDKSLRQALRVSWLARPAYSGLRAVWAQTPDDATRLRQLGAPVQGVMGNFKFDVLPDVAQLALGRQWRMAHGKPVLMFASSREGEEDLWLEALQGLSADARQALASVQWLVVPRHPQRFDEVAQALQGAGFAVSRRSQWQGTPPPAHVWLGDSLGEMAMYFGLADAALLGGSFAPLGGQNLIEAAACGCPVIMGPHTFNFADAARTAAQEGAAFEVPDMPAALVLAGELLASDAQHLKARNAAHAWSQSHRGAAARTVAAIVEQVL